MTNRDLTDLPRLPFETPESLDRAVEHAFWLLRGLERAVRDAAPDARPDPDERIRRRARLRDLSDRLARVGSGAEAAPRAVRSRRR